jgi:hypothetical protein
MVLYANCLVRVLYLLVPASLLWLFWLIMSCLILCCVIQDEDDKEDDKPDEAAADKDKEDKPAAAAAAAADKPAEEGEAKQLEEGEIPPTPPTAKQVGQQMQSSLRQAGVCAAAVVR